VPQSKIIILVIVIIISRVVLNQYNRAYKRVFLQVVA